MQSAEPIARALRRLAAAGCLLAAGRAAAVLFDATGAASHNTNAPAGALADSGWQYEGRFGTFLGTAIAPHYFLTARHIGGDNSVPFEFAGSNYYPVAHVDYGGGSDLRLWRVSGRLPRYAPVYTGTNEIGAPLIVTGRGTRRGNLVTTGGSTNGWTWGTPDTVMRWGSNRVEDIAHDSDGFPYLYATFDRGAGPDESHLSGGDSGGASFVLADGVWQLAGIHCAVDGYFNHGTNNSEKFDAAIFDAYGLYVGTNNDWTLITNHVASGFYSSRVSAYYDWFTNAIPDFDSDADGLPDWWEKQYSGAIHGLAATNDPDRDRFDNLAEWIARTDPNDSNSFFRADALALTGGTAVLTFQGWSNRLYRVFRQDAPFAATGTWHEAGASPFAGAGGPTSWLDTNAVATARFYRVTVALPP